MFSGIDATSAVCQLRLKTNNSSYAFYYHKTSDGPLSIYGPLWAAYDIGSLPLTRQRQMCFASVSS